MVSNQSLHKLFWSGDRIGPDLIRIKSTWQSTDWTSILYAANFFYGIFPDTTKVPSVTIDVVRIYTVGIK